MTIPAVLMARRLGRALGLNRFAAGLLGGRSYEERFSALMLNTVRQGDCVWDIGANIGLYATQFADRVGALGHVVCFEPSPGNASRLVAATTGMANVTILQVALGATQGRMSFFQGTDVLGATSRVSNDGERQPDGVIEVNVVRGDDYGAIVGSITPPTVLKIDTEGFELEVLRGLQDTIKKACVRAIFVEVHFGLLEERGQSDAPAKIEAMLGCAGFRCEWPDMSHIAGFRPAK